jgi:hypothetical protein
MASYTNEYSRFPDKIMERHYFKDVDNSISSLVNQVKTLQSQGKYDKVNEILKNNTANLSQYILSAEYINAIDEEIRNLQIYAKNKKQSIFLTDDEPEDAVLGDVWISNADILESLNESEIL